MLMVAERKLIVRVVIVWKQGQTEGTRNALLANNVYGDVEFDYGRISWPCTPQDFIEIFVRKTTAISATWRSIFERKN
jgi:hypothetical protein